MLKKKPNFKKWQEHIKVEKQLPLVANEIISDIVLRTQSGRDVNNKAFKKYSEDYANKKGSTKVNLTASNDMLNSITWTTLKGNKKGIKLYFSSTNQHNKAKGNQKTRKFFGLSTQQRKQLIKDLQKAMQYK